MNRSTLSRAAFAAASVVTVAGAVVGSPRTQQIAKPLMVPALAAGVSRPALPIATALAAATLGDVLLIDPDDDTRILRGAAAFAVMQGCYIGLLSSRGARPRAVNLVPRFAGWAAAAVTLGRRSRDVAPGLSGYGLTLATMSTLAADPSLAPGTRRFCGLVVPGVDPRSRLALGGVLFTVSDALIVFRRLFLVSESHRRAAEGTILATYALAQLFLVEGLSRQ